MDNVAAAAEFVDYHSKYLLLLGVEQHEFHADYGWIETSMKIADIRRLRNLSGEAILGEAEQ